MHRVIMFVPWPVILAVLLFACVVIGAGLGTIVADLLYDPYDWEQDEL